MSINPNIFKAYDIRGKFPKELNVDAARRIGNAVAVFLSRKYKKKAPTLVVGADVRTSSPVLKKALIDGITLQGGAVIDAGTVTTPLFYFLLGAHKPDGGVMITASHNPPEYNGFKILNRKTEPVGEESGLRAIQKLANARTLAEGKTLGSIVEKYGGDEPYIRELSKKAKIGRVRVAVDAGGGTSALVLPKLLAHFSEVIYKPLFFKPDGTFSVHGPNPLEPETQEFIKEELREGGFDFGVLFDGDGDRVIFFDELGNEVRADYILAILAEELLRRKPKSWVVLELTASKAVEEKILALGGKIVRSKTGYTNMTPLMMKKKALLGGETSGHFFFRDFGYHESSMYAFLKILEIVSATPKKLSHFVRPLQRYVNGPQNNFKAADKKKIIRAVKSRYGKKGKTSELDGITVEFPDWWFNVRASNTEPLVRLTLEAKTRSLFEEKKKELSEFIHSVK